MGTNTATAQGSTRNAYEIVALAVLFGYHVDWMGRANFVAEPQDCAAAGSRTGCA
jgi:hypothetical protein